MGSLPTLNKRFDRKDEGEHHKQEYQVILQKNACDIAVRSVVRDLMYRPCHPLRDSVDALP